MRRGRRRTPLCVLGNSIYIVGFRIISTNTCSFSRYLLVKRIGSTDFVNYIQMYMGVVSRKRALQVATKKLSSRVNDGIFLDLLWQDRALVNISSDMLYVPGKCLRRSVVVGEGVPFCRNDTGYLIRACCGLILKKGKECYRIVQERCIFGVPHPPQVTAIIGTSYEKQKPNL